MKYETVKVKDLPTMPYEPQRGADNEYLSRLYLNSLVFVLSQTPEQQADDIAVYKNRDKIIFGEEKAPVTLQIGFNREPVTITENNEKIIIPAGWIGNIVLGKVDIYPRLYPHRMSYTPEEAVAELLVILHNSEKVRELYKEAQEIEIW